MDVFKKARNKVQATVQDIKTVADQARYTSGGQYQPKFQYGVPAPSQSEYPAQNEYQNQYSNQSQYGIPAPSQSGYPQQTDYQPQPYSGNQPQQQYRSQPQSQHQYPNQPQQNYGQNQLPREKNYQHSPGASHSVAAPTYPPPPQNLPSQQGQPSYYGNYTVGTTPAYQHPTYQPYVQSLGTASSIMPGPNQYPHPPIQNPSKVPQQPPYQAHTIVPPQVKLPDMSSLRLDDKCTGNDAALADYVQFYVLKPEVLLGSAKTPLDENEVVICSSCFVSKISPYSALSSSFTPRARNTQDPSGNAPKISHDRLVCTFRLPSIVNLFYKQCVPRSSMDPIVEYLRSPDWDPCIGPNWVPSTGQTYYGVKEMGIDNFGCCITCFKLYLRFTVFEGYFTPMSDPPDPTMLFGCGFGIQPYTERVIRTELHKPVPDFNRAVVEIKRRMEVPICSGEGIAIVPKGSGDTFIYAPARDKSDVFCGECYFDHICGTVLENTLGVYTQLEESEKGIVECDLTSKFSKAAMGVAVRAGDDEIWRSVMEKRQEVPACVGIKGVDEEEFEKQKASKGALADWYCFKEFPSVEICPQCYWTTVKLVGATHLLSPITRPLKNGVVRMCFLSSAADPSVDSADSSNFENTLIWRGQMLRETLSYGYDSGGNFAPALAVASRISKLPPPCGSIWCTFKQPSGRKWLGRVPAISHDDPDDCQVTLCEECHQDIVKGSPVESELSQDLTIALQSIPGGIGCMAATKRAKRELREACQGGSFVPFAHYRKKRLAVWNRRETLDKEMNTHANLQRKALSVLDMENAQMGTQIMMNNNAAMNATIMGVGGSVAQASSNNIYQVGYTPGSMGGGSIMGTIGSMQQKSLAMIEEYKVVQSEWEAIQ